MERSERIHWIVNKLNPPGRIVTRAQIMEAFEVSRATLNRDIQYLRDRFGAPIEFDRDKNGYRLDGSERFELPGIWFSAEEAHSLLTIQHLLQNLQPDLLGPQLEPIKEKIQAILGRGEQSADEINRRIRVLPQASRRTDPKHFEVISSAVLDRKRLKVTHYHRGRDERTERELSPQRLIHYRDNWYLDAWCHLREGLRSFSVDTIESVEILNKEAKNISDDELDTEFASSYGIFGVQPVETAVLKFSPESARWVANETWHPEQKGKFTEDGFYQLEVPYSHTQELMMDILKHGSGVEVVGPPSLVNRIRGELERAARCYG